jgi:hypothetical protein
MKLLLSPALLLVVSSTLLAQGTFWASNNYVPPGKTEKAYITGSDGRPLDRTLGRIRIRHGQLGPILTPNGESGIPLTLHGMFSTPILTVPGVPAGGSADLVLEVFVSTREWVGPVTCGSVSVRISNLGRRTTPANFKDNSDFVGVVAYWRYPSYVTLFPPTRDSDGNLEIQGCSDSSWLAALYTSTNWTDWTFVKNEWVTGWNPYFPDFPGPGTFRFSLPPGTSSQQFKIVW